MKNMLKQFTLVPSILAAPLLSNAALIIQYDYNDTGGASTLDTQFPNAPAITGTQQTPGDPVTFNADVPNVHGGGFSGEHHKGTSPNEVLLKFKASADLWPGMTNMTFTSWVKPDAAATGQLRPFHGSGQFWIQRQNATTMRIHYATSNIDGTLETPLDAWTFMAITYDGTDFTFYSRAEGAPGFTSNVVTSAGLSVGTTGFDDTAHTSHPGNVNQGWHGLMDNMRVYDNALSEVELDAVYSYSDTIIPEPAHYSFGLGIVIVFGLALRRKRQRNRSN